MYKITSYAVSHIGKRRKNNEDNYFLSENIFIPESIQKKMTFSSFTSVSDYGEYTYVNNRIFAVSDGMGGHSFGEVASRMTVQGLGNFEKEILDVGTNIEKNMYIEMFQNAVVDINRNILKFAEHNDSADNMGATLSGIIIFNDKVFPVNIGDSSTFLFYNEQLEKLTKDNNEAQMLIDTDILTIHDTDILKKKKKLTKYFGFSEEKGRLTASVSNPIHIAEGQIYIICSDGVTDAISHDRIEKVISENNSDVSNTAEALLSEVLNNSQDGGKDNITIVIVKII